MLASPHWVISLLCNLYDNDQVPWDWLPPHRLPASYTTAYQTYLLGFTPAFFVLATQFQKRMFAHAYNMVAGTLVEVINLVKPRR